MSGFWKGYANVNDDVRHTYEQVFFGRQTTGNLTENEVPGMKPAPTTAATDPKAPDANAASLYGPDPEPTREEREATAAAWEHAKNAPGIRAEIAAAEGQPYYYANAPDIQPSNERPAYNHAEFYNSIWGNGQATQDGGSVWGQEQAAPDTGSVWGNAPAQQAETAQVEAPQIEAPKIEPPSQGNDMTPGY